MCFSAGASISAGILLTFVGVETIKKIHKPSQLAFASVPLFFAFQQFAEGAVWLTIGHPELKALETVVTYIYAVMAQAVWPMIIPLAVLLLEENKLRRRILYGFFAGGVAIGLYSLYRLIFFDLHAQITGFHMSYQSTTADGFSRQALFFYLGVTALPLFISSVKRMYILGIIMVLSFAASMYYYMQCMTSVWCFFAAVISFMIFYIIRDSHKKFHFAKNA